MKARIIKWAAVAGAAALGAIVPAALPAGAGGGGGCYEPLSDGRGAEVKLDYGCFTPTILRIKAGDEVTFRVTKRTTHTITGANQEWGSFRRVRKGDLRTFRFDQSGVYPYYCAYHVGMMGTIVVGNGKGPGSTAKDGGVVRIRSRPTAARAPLPDDTTERVRAGEMDLVPLIVIGAGLLTVGVVGVLLSVRTRMGRARIER